MVRTYRKVRGMTQEELGLRMQVHFTAVSKMERGVVSISSRMVQRLAQALQVEARDLLPQQARARQVETQKGWVATMKRWIGLGVLAGVLIGTPQLAVAQSCTPIFISGQSCTSCCTGSSCNVVCVPIVPRPK
ncbi:MAG: helix-turn-helix domain-containing protein [Cetobacterium sp.]